MKSIRIATRNSKLALWQAHYTRERLMMHYPNLQVDILGFQTTGDKILDTPLAKIGGKGLFVKELENALLNHQADIAVHSMKDVPVELPDELAIPVIMEREDPRDVFVSVLYQHLAELPLGATVGTSSLRRQCQIKALRPDLIMQDLRGNVDTRLKKIESQLYDAILLAGAGMKRLGWQDKITDWLPIETMLPAIGQGAIGIECRKSDSELIELLQALHHPPTAICVTAERALNQRLEGGCQVPIAAHAMIIENQLVLRALIGRVDGSEIIKSEKMGSIEHAESIGVDLANELLSLGGKEILTTLIQASHGH